MRLPSHFQIGQKQWELRHNINGLVTGAPETPYNNGKSKSALEGLLTNFACRESKRPGFGVRLFVQGCVLAGCDYAANSLPGVGL